MSAEDHGLGGEQARDEAHAGHGGERGDGTDRDGADRAPVVETAAPGAVVPAEAGGPSAGPASALDAVYGVLFEPRHALPRLAVHPPLGASAGVVALAALLQTGTLLGWGGAAGASGLAAGWVAALAAVPAGLMLWFASAAVWQLAAELLGGTGRGRVLLALTGLAQLPAVFTPLAVLLGRLTGWMGIEALARLAIPVWSLLLTTWSVRAAHGFGTARALAVVLAPLLAIGGLLALLAAAAVIAALRFWPQLPFGLS